MRNELITELNKFDVKTKNKTLFKSIEYFYSKNYLILKMVKRKIIKELN